MSSTAHLLIAERLLGFEDPGGVFTVMIQLGSILAVMWLYRRKIAAVLVGLPSDPDARRFALTIVVASIPALAAGALFSDYIKSVLYDSIRTFAVAFVAGGIVMLAAERWRRRPDVLDAEHTPVSRALGVGLCQMLALVPGVSRSGATIVGGMLMGIDRAAAAELSFFLAMPALTAAFGHDLLEVGELRRAALHHLGRRPRDPHLRRLRERCPGAVQDCGNCHRLRDDYLEVTNAPSSR